MNTRSTRRVPALMNAQAHGHAQGRLFVLEVMFEELSFLSDLKSLANYFVARLICAYGEP